MYRRTFSATLVALTLGACASRTPPPPLKPNSFRRLGMLPVFERPASGDIAALSTSTNARRAAQYGVVPPLNPMLLGMGIGGALRAAKDAEYNALADAVGAVPFPTLSAFQGLVKAELAARSVEIEEVADPQLAMSLRNDDYKALPTAFDGLLDVQLYNVGFYNLGLSRGFAPYLYIYARVLDVANPGEVAEDWSYNGTLDAASAGTHDFLLPPALTQATLHSFSVNADAIRSAFTVLLEKVARRLADDVAAFQRTRRVPRP